MKQTFIAIIKNRAGREITFERFSCKRAETVRTNMMQLFKSDLYRACTRGAETVEIYRTPDGYSREEKPVFTMNI